ncbi:MAG: glutamate-5-semialdehyde dehydrogenase [Clostridia bacterium]|nr:glutamate-5-semialdehyde dehydrogenase [Clostridia bacterium]
MQDRLISMADAARDAARRMQDLPGTVKDAALERIAVALEDGAAGIEEANALDLARAEADALPAPIMKRLRFDRPRILQTVAGIRDLARLPDPAGRTLLSRRLDAGLELYRVACPIGVIGIIFESRPDALVQISTLCLKSGNAVLLKGGSEAASTNRALADLIAAACAEAGIPDGWIGLMESREDVSRLLGMDDRVDLLIPRGSNAFVRHIMDNTRIPVLGHAEGVCHTYIDAQADAGMAVRVCLDAKAQYVAVCNATETVLIHRAAATEALPALADAFRSAGVEMFGDADVRAMTGCAPAGDWHTEYLDYKVSIRLVDSLDEAIDHINRYGSGHTDAIITRDADAAARFLSRVDSGNVFWNCSTRFSDGFRYGFGAEVGVSTSKIHARGPVGLEGLMTYKYKLIGNGDIVADFASGARSFRHEDLDRPCPL